MKSNNKMILKLYGDKNNTGGIVNFQNSLIKHCNSSLNEYKHYRTGRKQNSKFLSNPFIRIIDQLVSYCYYPLYLLLVKPDVVEINSSLVTDAFERDIIYAKLTKLIRPKTHLVLFNHGWNYEFKDTMLKQNRNRLISYFTTFDTIIVLAEVFKKELREDLSIDQNIVKVITTGINVLDYEKHLANGNDSEVINVLFLSRIEETKGVGQLLASIPTIIEDYPNIHFNIAGTGGYMSELMKSEILTQYSSYITLNGYVRGEDKLNLLKRSDIFAFPSYYGEGCPVSVLEALAVGLPIVYTKVGALPDLLEENINGILIEKELVSDLTKAILYLAKNKEIRNLISSNNLFLSKQFDLQIIHNKLEVIYLN